MDFSQDLVRGSVVPIVLSLLRERAMYGYELVKLVNARTNGRLEWKEGTLYPTLHQLEARGFVRGQWANAPASKAPGRKRKYYSVTPKGRAELARRSEEWQAFTQAVNACLFGEAL